MDTIRALSEGALLSEDEITDLASAGYGDLPPPRLDRIRQMAASLGRDCQKAPLASMDGVFENFSSAWRRAADIPATRRALLIKMSVILVALGDVVSLVDTVSSVATLWAVLEGLSSGLTEHETVDEACAVLISALEEDLVSRAEEGPEEDVLGSWSVSQVLAVCLSRFLGTVPTGCHWHSVLRIFSLDAWRRLAADAGGVPWLSAVVESWLSAPRPSVSPATPVYHPSLELAAMYPPAVDWALLSRRVLPVYEVGRVTELMLLATAPPVIAFLALCAQHAEDPAIVQAVVHHADVAFRVILPVDDSLPAPASDADATLPSPEEEDDDDDDGDDDDDDGVVDDDNEESSSGCSESSSTSEHLLLLSSDVDFGRADWYAALFSEVDSHSCRGRWWNSDAVLQDGDPAVIHAEALLLSIAVLLRASRLDTVDAGSLRAIYHSSVALLMSSHEIGREMMYSVAHHLLDAVFVMSGTSFLSQVFQEFVKQDLPSLLGEERIFLSYIRHCFAVDAEEHSQLLLGHLQSFDEGLFSKPVSWGMFNRRLDSLGLMLLFLSAGGRSSALVRASYAQLSLQYLLRRLLVLTFRKSLYRCGMHSLFLQGILMTVLDTSSEEAVRLCDLTVRRWFQCLSASESFDRLAAADLAEAGGDMGEFDPVLYPDVPVEELGDWVLEIESLPAEKMADEVGVDFLPECQVRILQMMRNHVWMASWTEHVPGFSAALLDFVQASSAEILLRDDVFESDGFVKCAVLEMLPEAVTCLLLQPQHQPEAEASLSRCLACLDHMHASSAGRIFESELAQAAASLQALRMNPNQQTPIK